MMTKLFLMASHGYPPGTGLLLLQEPSGVLKDYYLCSTIQGGKEEIRRPNSLYLRPYQRDERWNPVVGFENSSKITNVDSTITRPVLSNVQDTCSDSVFFSSAIAEHCTRREKILQLLKAGSSELQNGGLDLPLLSELMELEVFPFNVHHQPLTPLVYPGGDVETEKPLVYFVGDMARNLRITIEQDGGVLFADNSKEMKNILPIVAEFYLAKNSDNWKRKSMVIPNFSWLDASDMQANIPSQNVMYATAAPAKRAEKTKLKTHLKKRNSKKQGRERDLYKRSYFHACESLLSLMVDKNQHGKSAIISLKNSGPELPELLTQFSAGIAGTGLAVLFSVVYKMACGRVPFCASKLFTTGLGFGLVWFSWAVNGLRNTIIHVSKNATKIGMKDDEMLNTVERSLKDVYFRAATLMVVAVLRFA